MNSRNQTYLVYFLLLVSLLVMGYMAIKNQSEAPEPLTINQLASDIQSGDVAKITASENRLVVVYRDGTERTTNKEPETSLIDQLTKYGVTTEALTSTNLKIDIKLPSFWANLLSIFVVHTAHDRTGDRILVHPSSGARLEQCSHGLW